MQHTDFYGISTYIVENRADLSFDKLYRYGMYACDTDGVFVDNSHNHCGAVAAESRESLKIGLKPCATARVATGDGKRPAIFLSCHTPQRFNL